jgi:hypothetical protein
MSGLVSLYGTCWLSARRPRWQHSESPVGRKIATRIAASSSLSVPSLFAVDTHGPIGFRAMLGKIQTERSQIVFARSCAQYIAALEARHAFGPVPEMPAHWCFSILTTRHLS